MRCRIAALALIFSSLPAFAQVAPKADPKKPSADSAKDSVKKLTDGWYAVEFQVGAARVKAEFPGEPKLASADGEKTYSFTMAKEKRRFFVRVTDGYEGKIISENKGDVANGITKKWKETDPRYKDAIIRTGNLNNLPGVRINIEGSKTVMRGESWAVIANGCFIHAGIDNFTSDKAHKRFFDSIKAEKGEAATPEPTAALDIPKDWIEHVTKGKLGINVYAPPIQLTTGANVSGVYGTYSYTLPDGKLKAFDVQIQYYADDKGYQLDLCSFMVPGPTPITPILACWPGVP
jgi:hypothetical protein